MYTSKIFSGEPIAHKGINLVPSIHFLNSLFQLFTKDKGATITAFSTNPLLKL